MKIRIISSLLIGLTAFLGGVGISQAAWGEHRRNFHELIDLNPALYRQICSQIQSNSNNCNNTYRLGVPMYLVIGNLGEISYVTILNKQLYTWDWVNGNWIPERDMPVGTYQFVLLLREAQEESP
ncbi:MAG: hypothetical protein J7545_15775 [Roseofilum sp. SBFL]|uniref:hypothetical protein n=1 Tax=unclassified Roseofilum TaxID=2620099 RepID=UPI001B2450CB|nr:MULTISPECIES: hypothetical protein [unclassified Roseofilum]MBP0013319.1 hypothetical protein [Roseofilum sp. SID3]MBP0023838.1 hypothetical protein [Roseofilum sp. SID2]MBP0039932.1 hypothetical protein [Roseofilum sp. SID1]MBP0043407.1 hypothetical protein [Roseofilum sp. SBFL]